MAVFTIQAPDGRRIKIEAADQATAIRGAQEWAAANPNDAPSPPSAYDDALRAASEASRTFGAKPAAPAGPMSLGDQVANSVGATVNGLVASVPFLQNITDATAGGISQLAGGMSAQDYIARQRAIREGYDRSAPVSRVAGEVVGLIAGTGAAGATKLGAQALGLTGSLPTRIVNSGLSSGGLSVADAMSRGENVSDTLAQGGIGAAVGAILPAGGAVLRAGGRAIGENVVRPLATLAKLENEVTKRISTAMGQDVATGQRLAPELERVASQAGAPVINADRFGSAIRTLARTASNVSPEADNVLRGVTEQRFLTQANRAQSFLRRLMGGAVDDLGLQDALQAAARKTNKTAYDAAYSAPKAAAVWTPEIRGLMQASPFRAAIDAAEEVSTNAAAVSGGKAVRNPFVFSPDGSVTLRQMPDGSYAMPNLEFWDVVQRNLRRQSEMAYKSGDNLLGGQVRDMRNQLNTILDTAVPQFKKARRGAAGFFGAEDAIEAGRKAAKGTRNVPEVQRAVAAMPKAEQDAFSVGYVSELIDNLGAGRDRTNAIEAVFGRPESRQRIAAALGPVRARQLEAYVRAEQALDLLRGAVGGNSTTTKQLIAAGVIGGGGGLLASGGNLGQGANWAMLAAAGRRGLQMLGKRVDEEVMRQVADVLASGDPNRLQRAISQAAIDKRHMDALHAIMRGLAVGARGAAMAAVTPNNQP